MVFDYFKEHDALKCLTVNIINEITKRFVDFSDSDSYNSVMALYIKQCLTYLEGKMAESAEVEGCIKQFKDEKEAELQQSVIHLLDRQAESASNRNTTAGASGSNTKVRAASQTPPKANVQVPFEVSSDEDVDIPEPVLPKRTTSKTQATGRGKARGTPRGVKK
ncbi:unnamed protein product [Acanthoscelides obtectus]|nr:unnamed protein product [Acanthoscelides obtectus]CAK1672176.1 hypothetical protein AOBTE_LOCUS28697 [Acanthoscelides obtectus]